MRTTTTTAPANVTGTSYGWTTFDRYIGTCRSCKTTFAVTVPGGRFHEERRVCPECGDWTVVKQVVGSYSSKKVCDGRCVNAKRSDCECSCGGANHGAGH